MVISQSDPAVSAERALSNKITKIHLAKCRQITHYNIKARGTVQVDTDVLQDRDSQAEILQNRVRI